jgi:microcystin-dependent protein
MALIDSFGYAAICMPHNNMKPCPALDYCIALQGVFAPRL